MPGEFDRDTSVAARIYAGDDRQTHGTTPTGSGRCPPSSRVNQYHVVLEVKPTFRRHPLNLRDILSASSGGQLYRNRQV